MDLQECREALEKIDVQLVELFEERMQVSSMVAEAKLGSGRAVYDSAQEAKKLARLGGMTHNEFNRTAVRELFSQLMTIGRRLQYKVLGEHGRYENLGFAAVKKLPVEGARIVFQGVEGAFGHCAALQFFGEDADLYHVPTFEDAMREVADERADFAVLPIENSTAGAVVDMYDLLIRYRNFIVAETILPVRHSLLGLPGAGIEEIESVYSHPQALMQCSHFLSGQKQMCQYSCENTAVAAKRVVEEGNPRHAAIASDIAGRLYGLEVLKPAIQNVRENTTRFIVLAKQPIYVRDAGKISLYFELPHRSGTLYTMLGNFIFNNVNMVMIESRPIPERPWEYRFFVDIEGNLEDPGVKNALLGIQAEALTLRILGNFCSARP